MTSYGPHDLQTYRVFHYSSHINTSVIFIHGGAWRDPNNTYDDFEVMAQAIPANSFGVNYRLSPEVKHPTHLNDVTAGIQAILDAYHSDKVILVGHSVGATLIMQILQKSDITIDGAIYIDGIYDIKDLVLEYPDYSSFVNEAHEVVEDQPSFIQKPPSVVIQSTEDELLSVRQSEGFCKRLQKENVTFEYKCEAWGKHEEVYRNPKVCEIVGKVVEWKG